MIRISVNAYNSIVPVESPHLTKVATWKPLNLTFWFHYPSRYIWWSFLLSMNKVIAVVIPCSYVYTCIHVFPGGNHGKDNAVTVPQLQSSILLSSIQGFGNLPVTYIYIYVESLATAITSWSYVAIPHSSKCWGLNFLWFTKFLYKKWFSG